MSADVVDRLDEHCARRGLKRSAALTLGAVELMAQWTSKEVQEKMVLV